MKKIDMPITKAEWDAVLDDMARWKPGSPGRHQFVKGMELWGKPIILDADAPKFGEPGSA